MNDPNQNFQNQNINPNQSLDYEQWVNALGNIQDGIFQNTPVSNSIIQNTANSALRNNSFNNSSFGTAQDLNLDLFFNSPERFYRDIINESPIVTKTPQVGRTPLKNLNINFSTPNFLKNIDTGGLDRSANKNFTPLKNQLFNSKVELFETPKLNKQNSTTLNSSPTTIKIGSSAIKNDENSNQNNQNKMIPPSPTPASKINILPNQQTAPPSIPKMGCFKKAEPEKQVHTKRPATNNSKFQIIMTDVNSFTNNSKPSRPKKKKLTRSATSVNASANAVTKKSSLKRSLSQPQAKFMKSLTPIKSTSKLEQSPENSEISSSVTSQTSGSDIQDVFDF